MIKVEVANPGGSFAPGERYAYWVHDAYAGEQLTLVASFHGLGEDSNNNAVPISAIMGAGLPGALEASTEITNLCIVAFQHRTGFWTDLDVNRMINAFISVEQDTNGNINVYDKNIPTGFSSGGLGVLEYAENFLSNVAAMAPMSMNAGSVDETVFEDLHVWAIHGDNDTNTSTNTFNTPQLVTRIRDAAGYTGKAKMTLFPGGHTNSIWEGVFDGSQIDNESDSFPAPYSSEVSDAFPANLQEWMYTVGLEANGVGADPAPSYVANPALISFFKKKKWALTNIADETSPILTSAGATVTGSTTVDVSVTTDEANGELFVVITTSATQPSTSQIEAGQDHTGSTGVTDASQIISSTGVKTFNITGLTASTSYYAHFFQRDAASNESSVVSTAEFTTESADVTSPTFSNVSVDNIAATTADFNAEIDEAGTIYWAVYPTATALEDEADIIAGTGAIDFGSIGTSGSTIETDGITGLTASTAYRVHYFGRDASNNDSTPVRTSEFTTSAAGAKIARTNYSLSLGAIDGTWNSLAGNPHLGVISISNIVDTTGVGTGWGNQTIAGGWTAFGGNSADNTLGTGGGSLYPDTATESYMFSNANACAVKYTSLDNGKTYTIRCFASRQVAGATSGRSTNFTVAGVTQTLVVSDNTDNFVEFTGVSPTAGEIVINIAQGTGSSSTFMYINITEIEEE